MTTASVSFPNLSDSPPDSSDCNQNFTDLVNYLNTNAIVADGTLAWTTIPEVTGAPTPVSDNQAAHMKYTLGVHRPSSDRRSFYQTAVVGTDTPSSTFAGDGIANTTQHRYGPNLTITIPSWATTAMITAKWVVNFGDMGGADATFRYGICFNASGAKTNMGTHNFELKSPIAGEGFPDQTNPHHNFTQKTLWTVHAPLKGATHTVNFWNKLTGGGNDSSKWFLMAGIGYMSLEMEFFA